MKPIRFLLVALALATAGCYGDPIVVVRGRVVDEAGRPVADAAITFEVLADPKSRPDPPVRGKTDRTGEIDLMTVRDLKQTFLLRVEKEGYEPYEKRITTRKTEGLVIRLVKRK